MKPRPILISLAIIVSVSLMYWPTFRWLGQVWVSNPYYSHGFLVPLVSGFFVWTKRHEVARGKPSIAGPFVLVTGAFVYILGFVWGMRSLSALSLLIVITGLALSFSGTKATRALVFPLSFLLFMIPPPFLQEAGFVLQTWSVRSSAWLLKVAGLPITAIGPEIHLGDTTFVIGLPCSGINTLVALLALAAVYAYLLRGPIPRRALLLVIAFPLAILANIFRVASVILVAKYQGAEVATGLYHDISSPIFFLAAFLCLALLGRILGCRLSYDFLRS